MSTIAVPQLLTGNVLSDAQISDIWKWAANTTNPINPEGTVITGLGENAGSVNNPDILANHVLQTMFGYKNYTLTFGHSLTGSVLVAQKERVKTPTHFILGNFNRETIYNPTPYLLGPHLRYDTVFLQIKQ